MTLCLNFFIYKKLMKEILTDTQTSSAESDEINGIKIKGRREF